MKIEEFENIFGNVPYDNLKKINKYIKDNYISKDELKEILYKDYGETIYDYHYAYEELFNKIENLL